MGKNGIRRVKAARRSKIAALHNIGLPHLNIHGNTKSKKALALALAASQAQAQQAQAQVHQMTPEEEAEWHSCFVVSFNRRGNYIAAGHASGVVPIHDFGSRTLSSIFTSPMRSESVRILQEKDGEDICVEKMELKLHQKKKDELEEGKDADADADADMEEKSKGHKSSDEGSSDDEVDMERERQRKREQKKRSSYFDTEIADDHKTSEEKSSPSASSSSSAPPSRLFQNGITSISWSRQSKKMMIGSYKDNLLCIVDNTHPYGPEDVYFGITGKKDKGSSAGSGAGNASTKDKEKRCVSPVPVEKDGEGSPSAAAENPTGGSSEKGSARARARSRAESAVDTPATASASAATNTNIANITSPMGTRNQRSSSTVMMTNGGDEKQSHLNDLNWLPKSSLLQPKTGDKPKHKNLKPKSNNNDDDDNDGDADSNNSNDKTDNKANTNTNAEGVELTAEELTILSKQPPFSYEEKYILQMLSNRMEEAGCTIEQAYEATKKKIVQTTRCQTLVMPLPQGIGLCAQLHPSGNGGLACLEDGSLLLFHTPTSAFENCVYADPDVTSEMEGRKSRVMGNYVYLSMPIASIPKIHRDGNSGGGDGGGDGDGDGNKDGEKNTTNTHRHGPTTPYHVVCARFDTMGDAVFATTKCGKLVVYELDEQLKKALFHNAPTADPDEEEPSKYFKFKTKSQTYMKISGSGSGSAVAPHQIALSQNGQMLLLNCKDGVLRLYETSALLVAEKLTMEKTPGKGWIRQIDVSPRLMFQDIVSKSRWASCDFSGDGEYVVGGCNNEDSGSGDKYELYFWNTTTGVLIDQLTGPQIHLYSISWHPTRSFIAVGTSDGLVDLWGPRLDWQNFAPDFQSLQNNVEYVEKEDEFDTIVDGDHDEEAKRKELADRIEEEAIVDIITIDEDSDGEDEAFFFQTKLQSMRSNFL